VLVRHGRDGEGWGPVTRSELDELLDQAAATGAVIAPPEEVLTLALVRAG